LIDNRQPFQPPAVIGLIMNEVESPDLVEAGRGMPLPQALLRAARAGTFRPSCFQIRCTRLSLTCRPSRRSRRVTPR
jgi:hypothetical protein